MTLYRKFFALALVLAGWSEILSGGRAGVGWLVLVGMAWAAAQILAIALESPRTLSSQLLWLIPSGFGISVTLYDSEVVGSLGPILVLLSSAVCLMFTLTPPKALEDLSCLYLPLARSWMGGWSRFPDAGASASAGLKAPALDSRSLGRGLLISVPLLAAFGALFCAADSEFGDSILAVFSYFSPDMIVGPARWILYSLAWATLLLGVAFRESTSLPDVAEEQSYSGDWQVALTLVNLLFGSFLAVQAPRMFATHMDAVRLAAYAHEGFGQLLLCTVLVYLLVKFLYPRFLYGAQAQRPMRALTALLLIQAVGVGASAIHRLWLYSAGFGLSVLRIYAFLGVAASCVLLALLVLACVFRPAPLRLQALLNLTGAAVLVLAGWVNVEGWAASSHLARGEVPDVAYLKTLSADALPALQAAPPSPLIKTLLAERLHTAPGPWYSWNLSRSR